MKIRTLSRALSVALLAGARGERHIHCTDGGDTHEADHRSL